jgi:predicted lipoprotein with Yx(FWY)xxD motif
MSDITQAWPLRILTGSVVTAVLIGSTIAAATASTSQRTAPQLQSSNASSYRGVLANSKDFSLYVLSVETGGKLHCTTALCLKTWPPYLVKAATRRITLGTGVRGKVGFVKRTSTMKQVTFNSYPVYRYSGDTSPKQGNGEGIVADGGTWTLVHASATTPEGTPVKPKAMTLLTSVSSPPYSNVRATASQVSLYALSTESGGVLHCTGSCLSIWPPLLVANSVTSVQVGLGVDGTIGFVARSSTMKQVTDNGFPVYTYLGDSGPAQSNGEGIVADGGTWDLVSATATTPGTTQIPPQ